MKGPYSRSSRDLSRVQRFTSTNWRHLWDPYSIYQSIKMTGALQRGHLGDDIEPPLVASSEGLWEPSSAGGISGPLLTLDGSARGWSENLLTGSIDGWTELRQQFAIRSRSIGRGNVRALLRKPKPHHEAATKEHIDGLGRFRWGSSKAVGKN
nr:hypothetical protein [Tanacetum cinerariifolium]